MTTPEDKYQQRYLSHQAKKSAILADLLAERHSERMFADGPLAMADLYPIIHAGGSGPSSCNRQAIQLTVVTERDQKALLGGLMVGGVGWVHRAPAVLMLFADSTAYKAGDEIAYMPYLDAGVAVGLMSLAAQAAGLASCFVNPNIRESNRAFFHEEFAPRSHVFCGALAVGRPRVPAPDWVQETS